MQSRYLLTEETYYKPSYSMSKDTQIYKIIEF